MENLQTFKNQLKIERAAKYGFEPLTFDYYDEASLDWVYKPATCENLSYFRHTTSGKLYKANQRKRMMDHYYDLKYRN